MRGSQKFLGIIVALLFGLLVMTVYRNISLHHYITAAQGDVVELKQSQFCTIWKGAAGILQQYGMRLEEEGIHYREKHREPSYSGESILCLYSDTPGEIIVPKSLLEFEVKVDPTT